MNWIQFLAVFFLLCIVNVVIAYELKKPKDKVVNLGFTGEITNFEKGLGIYKGYRINEKDTVGFEDTVCMYGIGDTIELKDKRIFK